MAPSGIPSLLSQSWFGKEVRHSLKGLCGSKKLEENEMFQKFKMKMLPASNEGRDAGLKEGKATSQRSKMKLKENSGFQRLPPSSDVDANHRMIFVLFPTSSICSTTHSLMSIPQARRRSFVISYLRPTHIALCYL